MLMAMWSSCDSHTLLVGMGNGTLHRQNSSAVFRKSSKHLYCNPQIEFDVLT